MNIGDIVKWARFKNDQKLTEVFKETEERLNDIGIILDIDSWAPEDTEPETIVVEVYFLKVFSF